MDVGGISEELRELQPETVAELERVLGVAAQAADPALVERCARHAAALLAGEAGTVEGSPRELAYLEFTEQFVVSVSSVSDAQVEALLEHDSPQDVYAFIGALYALEMSRRLELVAGAVLR